MAKTPVFLARFDPQLEYLVVKKFIARGREQIVDSMFDKSLVTTRTLRLLYEQRKIVPMGGAHRQRYTPGNPFPHRVDKQLRAVERPPPVEPLVWSPRKSGAITKFYVMRGEQMISGPHKKAEHDAAMAAAGEIAALLDRDVA